MKLLDLIGPAPAVAMLGMCKNAGKTTALTHLIRDYARVGKSIALTSIGRDGERVDLVTGTEKPPIYMYKGMLAATASELLALSDVSREILDVTGISTPMGRIVIFRAMSDGFVQLAGPSIVEQMGLLRGRLHELGAQTVLVDGALSRRSPAAGVLDGVCVLSTGASLDRDLDTVVGETGFVCRILTLPEILPAGSAAGRFVLFRDGESFDFDNAEALLSALKAGKGGQVLLAGALSEALGQRILRGGFSLEGLELVLEDSSRILLKKETFEKLCGRGLRFGVRQGTRLAAVTLNPVSAGGWRFDEGEFMEKMRAASPAPVLNVGRYDGTEL